MSEYVRTTEQTREAVKEVLEHLPTSPNGNGATADAAPPAMPARRWHRRPLPLAILGLMVLALAIISTHYYNYAMAHESTDDAFIEAHIVQISPKVASLVARVAIDDNQQVKAGDLLVELDPRDFEVKLAQARANLAAAVAQHDGARSRVEQARAQVAAAEAEATRAATDVQRYERLLQDGAVSRQERDNAVAKNRAAAANLEAAQKAQQAGADSLRQAAAQIAQLEAAVRQAELDLSYTKIVAPEAGRITRKSVEPGAYVQVGQTLFSIVPDRFWVVANFKETQLRHMRPGQPARIKVDAYRDKVFKGHVDSIQAGSGARFSLLPPENATGNYVKVVQRVPVKILIDDPPDPTHVLGPGMSVVPEVAIR